MKIFLGRLFVLFFVATAVWVSIKDKTLFHVKEIKISTQVEDSERAVWVELNQEIEKTLAVYKGLPIWKVSLAEVKRRLAPFAVISNLNLLKSWPEKIEVSYSLPSLKAIYRNSEGQFKVLATGGLWVGPVKWSRLPVLPWVKGRWVEKNDLMTKQLMSLLDQLPEKGLFSKEQISEVQFNDLDGFLLTLIKSGQQIRFGTENFEIKSLRVAQVLEYLQTRGLESRVIDANFSKKVLVRLRNHP